VEALRLAVGGGTVDGDRLCWPKPGHASRIEARVSPANRTPRRPALKHAGAWQVEGRETARPILIMIAGTGDP